GPLPERLVDHADPRADRSGRRVLPRIRQSRFPHSRPPAVLQSAGDAGRPVNDAVRASLLRECGLPGRVPDRDGRDRAARLRRPDARGTRGEPAGAVLYRYLGCSPPRGEGGAAMTGTLLVTSGDFGWGAAGKLKLILDQLPGVQAVGVGGDLGRALLGSVDYIDSTDVGRETLRQVVSSHDVRVALVVGSNDVARALVSLGTPVVFVDSLPYLWTVHDNVPTDAAVYCAQACTVLPRLAWPVLAQIQNLRWIEAIVPAPRRCLGGGGAVLSVGGLHSDSSGDAA